MFEQWEQETIVFVVLGLEWFYLFWLFWFLIWLLFGVVPCFRTGPVIISELCEGRTELLAVLYHAVGVPPYHRCNCLADYFDDCLFWFLIFFLILWWTVPCCWMGHTLLGWALEGGRTRLLIGLNHWSTILSL